MKYTVTLYEEDYNFETHKYELSKGRKFVFNDYDSVRNLLGYMSEGNENILVRIVKDGENNE